MCRITNLRDKFVVVGEVSAAVYARVGTVAWGQVGLKSFDHRAAAGSGGAAAGASSWCPRSRRRYYSWSQPCSLTEAPGSWESTAPRPGDFVALSTTTTSTPKRRRLRLEEDVATRGLSQRASRWRQRCLFFSNSTSLTTRRSAVQPAWLTLSLLLLLLMETRRQIGRHLEQEKICLLKIHVFIINFLLISFTISDICE